MKGVKKLRTRLATTLAVISMVLLLSVTAGAQKITSLNASAKGQGTINISDMDKHQITSVLLILKEDGNAELTFYTDLPLSAQGTWSIAKTLEEGINLKITGGVVGGGAAGNGKLF